MHFGPEHDHRFLVSLSIRNFTDNVWTGLANPQMNTCNNAGCSNNLRWSLDNTLYTHDTFDGKLNAAWVTVGSECLLARALNGVDDVYHTVCSNSRKVMCQGHCDGSPKPTPGEWRCPSCLGGMFGKD